MIASYARQSTGVKIVYSNHRISTIQNCVCSRNVDTEFSKDRVPLRGLSGPRLQGEAQDQDAHPPRPGLHPATAARLTRLGIVIFRIQRLLPASISLDDHRASPKPSCLIPPTKHDHDVPTMSSFFNKLEHLADKLPEGLDHARAMAIG